MNEVEIRDLIDNVDITISTLKENGFKKLKEIKQLDMIFDTEDARLFREGRKIRIRIEDNKVELTYKGNFSEKLNVSERSELNIDIKDIDINNYNIFLTSLGYPLCFKIQKNRQLWEKDDIQITIDEWPIIGNILEIEGDEEKIIKIAKELFPNNKFRNYRLKEFFADKMNKKNKNIEQLKDEYLKETGFDLGKIELILN